MFGLEGVQDADVGVGVEHLVVDVLAVHELEFVEFKGLPGAFELLVFHGYCLL